MTCEKIRDLIESQGIFDPEGNQIMINDVHNLDLSLVERYISGYARNPVLSSLKVFTHDKTDSYYHIQSTIDQVVILNGSEIELITCDDGISYESLSLFQLVEYAFESDGQIGPWMISCIGVECLESYKGSKFSLWRSNMLTAFNGCAAAFIPELHRGYALSAVYDHMIFSSDAGERSKWEVEHNNKIVNIPRPVKALRIWNSNTQSYESISPHMPGAPLESDQQRYWLEFLQELRNNLNPKYGDDFVDDCLSANDAVKIADLKYKYGF